MLKLLLLGLPFIPVALAQAHSPSPGGSADKPVRCEIRQSHDGGSVQLDGMVLSRKPLAGRYEFEVKKQGGAGTSSTVQSGLFEVGANGESRLGQVGLRLERGASYSAELTIHWPGGEAVCVKHFPDRA